MTPGSVVPKARRAGIPARTGAGWTLTLWPGAREAGGSFRYSREPDTSASSRDGSEPDLDRSRAEAARRARATVRRYAAANRTNRLGTLTYGGTGCADPVHLRADVGEFFRNLRTGLGGAALPYIWTVEDHRVHDDGTWHGLHVHFAVGRYVPRRLIEQAWGRGFVHIKLIGQLPVGSGKVEEARAAARYLSKYIGKAFESERLPGLHRYDVAQGHQPVRERLTGRSAADVLAMATEKMGRSPSVVWSSASAFQWHGPPSVWASWPG
jgi:hypothetical protein